MLKQRYNQAVNAIHADEELIELTLDAAARPRTKSAPISPTGRRLIIVFVCTLVVIAALLPRLTHPHQDILTSNGELPEDTGDLLPLPSDELTLSISDVQLLSDTELSLILTMQGDKVDPLTTIDWDYHSTFPSVYVSETRMLDAYEGQPENEQRFQLIIESRERHILDVLGPTLNLRITRYTIGNQKTETVHEIDWSTVDFTLQEEGEPIIDLGSGLSICGFGFSEEGWLIVQDRCPITSLDPTYIMNWLSANSEDAARSEIYIRKVTSYVKGDYRYSDSIFPVTREELAGIDLGILAVVAGEEIRGSWPITIDLSHLTAE